MALQKEKTLYLVDASSYLHRAYHAIRNLSNSKGFPTNALFGFTKMLLSLITEKHPAYLAVVFDSKGPTFRHKIYTDYKAKRPPMTESMAAQIPLAKEVVGLLNVRLLEKEGYEADDIIGTLARISENQGFKVVIVSGDKDFRQIITPETTMWDTMKGTITDYESIKKDYGLEPEKFIDVMALSGDTSDNIPGVPGIGEKTALELVRSLGSLEAVLDQAAGLEKKKLRENLLKHRNDALLSKDLVAINQFVPLDEDVGDFRVGEPEKEQLSEFFRKMEFRDLWERFTERRQQGGEYQLCVSKEELGSLVEKIKEAGEVCIDTETTDQNPLRARLVGLAFCFQEGLAYYLPLEHRYPGAPVQQSWSDVFPLLQEILSDDGIVKVGQNIKYDAEVLKLHGLELKGIWFDTMIASYVLNPGLRQYGLDFLSQHFLNHKMMSFQEVVKKDGKKGCFSEVDVELAKKYACEDADITFRLKGLLEKRLQDEKNEALFYQLEMKLVPVLMDMEMTGIRVDTALLNSISSRYGEELSALESEIYKEAGMEFNINSPRQLAFVLFEKLGLPALRKTAKGKNYSTDVGVLKKLATFPHRVPKLVLRYRTLAKIRSTYLDALVKLVDPFTGRLHTSYNQTATATGRLSSSNPNLQNVPIRGEEGKEIRKAFLANEGDFLLSADYSQVELRILAHYSRDEAFIEAFRRNEDIHARTASRLLGLKEGAVTAERRRLAKAINFGVIYGMGPLSLSEELGIDREAAKKYIASYLENYKGVARYREQVIARALEDGYVTTLYGRRRYLPNIRHESSVVRAEAERMAINTPIQGTAADLIKKAMINIYERINQEGLGAKILLQVHDELVLNVPEQELERVEHLVKEEMEGVQSLEVPLVVDLNRGRNWGEIH